MLQELPQKDASKSEVFVSYEPIGICMRLQVVDGKIDLSILQKTKYGNYITGISPRLDDDKYDVVLTPEGKELWDKERVRIGEWMIKWGCN